MAKQKRDNEYYLRRLKKERPDLYKEIQAGRMTVTAARQRAGLGATRNTLNQLTREWLNATPSVHRQFLAWLALGARPAPPASPSRAAFGSDGESLSWARGRWAEIMRKRKMTYGDLASELKINRLDQSVSTAVHRGTRVKSLTIRSSVDRWLAANVSV